MEGEWVGDDEGVGVLRGDGGAEAVGSFTQCCVSGNR